MSSVDSTGDAPELERDQVTREDLINAMRSPSQRIRAAMDVPFNRLANVVLVFMVAFLNLVDLSIDKDTVALDPQVLAKLMVIAGAGLYGFLGAVKDVRVRRILFSFPVFFIVMIIGLYFMASSTSITKEYSLVSAVAMLAVLLMTVTAMVQLGLVRFLTIVFHGMSLFIVLSWVVYYLWPEVGVFMEPITNGQFTRRMSGLAHSNTLGQYSGLTVIIGVALYHFYNQRSKLAIDRDRAGRSRFTGFVVSNLPDGHHGWADRHVSAIDFYR